MKQMKRLELCIDLMVDSKTERFVISLKLGPPCRRSEQKYFSLEVVTSCEECEGWAHWSLKHLIVYDGIPKFCKLDLVQFLIGFKLRNPVRHI